MSNFWTKLKMSADRMDWKWEGFRRALSARGFRLASPLLLLFALLLGAVSSAQAGTDMCSFYRKNPTDTVSVVDGNDPFVRANLPGSSFGIDMNCEFRNFPISPAWPNGLTPTLNFYTPDKSTIYLIAFDNVWFSGNMACANIDHKLWVVNSEEGAFSGACQDLMIPAETIAKQSPAATAAVGLPFTYTLTLPSMNFRAGDPSSHDLGAITVVDDLAATGADLALVSLNAHYKGTPTAVPITHFSDSSNKYLHFALPDIAAGAQVVVEATAVLNDTPANVPGMQFVNTARWAFARWIDLDEDGIQDANEYFNPLPGESGISTPMTIVAPNLVVSKTSPATALNLGDRAAFTIDVQNSGGGDAWNATIVDTIPVGMCAADPTATLSARIVQADGVTLVKALIPGIDYTVAYSGCQLNLTMTDAAGPNAPAQHLLITYQTQLDPGFTNDGATLTNVAGATQWFSANSSHAGRRVFTRTLTDGTPTVIDHQDSQTVTAALHGYYFEKTVANLTSQASPATTAAAGDRLRYKLRVFNVDQTIDSITISDPLDLNYFDPATFTMVAISADPAYNATYNFNPVTGLLQISGVPALSVAVRGELVIEFEIALKANLLGTTVANQARLSAAGGFTALSDDPYIDGVASPDVVGDENATLVEIRTPGPLTKTHTQPSATIGEHFSYLIQVPANPLAIPLYDVRLLDDLSRSASGMRFVSARVISGGTWTLANTSGSETNLVIEDTVTGIDIPANSQALIEMTVELLNASGNRSGLSFDNSATYTYNRANGVDSTRALGGAGRSTNMTVVEPAVTAARPATKTVRFDTPAGKAATAPAEAGDILEYRITIPNSGGSTAFDVNCVDVVGSGVALLPDSATATINGGAIPGFVANPAIRADGALVWGRENGDDALDIPAGEALVLTYRVRVLAVGAPLTNSALIDWTSLDGAYPVTPFPGVERTGAGCPATTAPNDYCYAVAPVTVATVDTNAIRKAVLSDTYAETPASATNPVVRVGDSVTYRLTVQLHEAVTGNVVVRDLLPAGMRLQAPPVITTSTGANLVFAPPVQPGIGANTLVWTFGEINNRSATVNPDGTDLLDELRIEYSALVVADPPDAGVSYAAAQARPNAATLAYAGGDPASSDPAVRARLNATATIEVLQPVLAAITKSDYGSGRTGSGTQADPYQVDIVNDAMQFRLQACNATGRAPAYNLVITDQLPVQLDLATLTVPLVKIGTGSDPAAAGVVPATDYLYALSGRQMRLAFADRRPLQPGECVFVEYGIGFANDIPPATTWSNSAQVQEYHSLPAQSGRQYAPTGTAAVYMQNVLALNAPTKSIALPVAPTSVVTIGEEVRYTITVPGTPVNAALANVTVSDSLDSALVYLGATVAGGLALTDNTSGREVRLVIAQIPAGEQAVITLRARVANTATPTTDAGDLFSNRASYLYNNTTWESLPTPLLTIVEPSVTVDLNVAAATPTIAGDILNATVNLSAAPAAASNAYDLVLAATLSPGLEYVANSASLGAPVLGVDPVSGGQTLSWVDFDLAAGTTRSVTYDVRVRDDVVIDQTLTNTVTARWTSLDGASADERSGSGSGPNDYLASDSASVVVGNSTTFAKLRASDTFAAADANVRIGDLIEYELRAGLQEGTHTGVVITDTLPTGLQYVAMVDAVFFGSVQATPPQPRGTQTLSWDLGTVVNPADGNAANDFLVLRLRARVLNNQVLAQTATQTLTNSAMLGYTVGGAALSTPLSTAGVTVLQPLVTVSTTAAPANGDGVVDAGERVAYTVDLVNSGTAPAYDLVLTGTLPPGMRQGGVTTTSVTLVNTGVVPNVLTPLGSFNPAYSADGVAVWNFDNGTPNAYTLPAGQTLRVVYTATVDSDVAAGLTLTGTAQATRYYSLDNNDLPPDGSAAYRETYASAAAATAVTTATPGALRKATTRSGAGIGEAFTYLITVPATPIPTALHDVRIYDDLAASAADLRLLGAAVLPGGSWAGTLVSSGDTGLVAIENRDSGGIDIPPNGQIQVAVTVVLLNSPRNLTPGLSFTNRAWYTYGNGVGTLGSDATTGDTSEGMLVTHPLLTLTKTGPVPATMRVGTPASFRLDVTNSGATPAWNVTVTDWLPNPTPGGMCDAGVSDLSATIFQADGITPVLALNPGEHYDTGFTVAAPAPRCELLLTTKAPAVIAPGQRLIVTYRVALDADSIDGGMLTNVAGASQWLSANPADGIAHTYTAALTDGTVGTVDHQDAFTVSVQGAVLTAQMTVTRLSADPSGAVTELPGTAAAPGDRLRYTITIRNQTDIPLRNFALADELERLHGAPMFLPGSINNVSVPSGASFAVTGNTLTVSGLNIGPNETLSSSFEATLLPVISNGSSILNQGQLILGGTVFAQTDDPAVAGDQNPTRTVVASAPVWRIEKTVDQRVVFAGKGLRYTITVKNVGDENAVNVVLRDPLPANAAYVANSTTLNGLPVSDVGGASPLQGGSWKIFAPENPTPGEMRADAGDTPANVATITFEVTVNAAVSDSTVIANQAFVNGTGSGAVAFPEAPSDDPTTTAAADPTLAVVLQPNGVVFDSVRRTPLAGVTLTMLRAATGTPLPAACFSDPAQQHQVTPADGAYKFDLNFSQPECPAGSEADYLIAVTAVPEGYVTTAYLIPPRSSVETAPYSVPVCSADAVPATEHCEAQALRSAPASGAAASYYLRLGLRDGRMPQESQIFNNHIPVDPELEAAIAITKTSSLVNVTRGQLVPYTITVKNTLGGVIPALEIVDTLPPGFKYVAGSARFDGAPLEPVNDDGRRLRWGNLALRYNEQHSLQLLLIVGAGVTEGEYVNRAQVRNVATGGQVSAEAMATVRIIPDPTFDCTDVLGKVFDDRDLNGSQDAGEKGLPGVRVVTARGLIASTDEHGRFHLACAAVPDEDRGSNFILKLDDRSLPTGYRVTTENPRVQRLTRGKALRYNFGATIHRLVSLDIADGIFAPESTEIRRQWRPKLDRLLEELGKSPAVLRLSYLADVEPAALVHRRLEALKAEIARQWELTHGGYRLTVETEVFWRRGAPPGR